MNQLRQFWHAADTLFDLPRRLRAVRDRRTDPPISAGVLDHQPVPGGRPARAFLPSFLQLQAETSRPGWQRLRGRSRPISDDSFGDGLERARLDDVRGLLVVVNQTLKRNKVFAAAKIHGLLVVARDANEQFKSRSRCCADCCQRQIKVTAPAGQVVEVTEYYHRQVYAQLHGPRLSTLLDREPIRPGEDEAAAALRLLGRMRRR